MKTWQKAVVVVVCGGAVWGLSYAGSIYTQFAFVTASFSAGITALCSLITGYPAKEE